MVLAGTLIVGGCGQKAADSTAATAQVTETSDSAPADKPDGAPGDNSDKPGNPPDGAPGSMDGKQAPPDGGNGGPGGPGGPGGQSAAPTSYPAVSSYSTDTEEDGKTYTSTGADESAVLVTDGAKVTLKNFTMDRNSADSTGGDNSSFYGTGAAALAANGSLTLTGGTITTDAKGGAGVFSYGDGNVTVSDTTITTKQDTSGGIHVAGGGTLTASNLTVETNGESSAAIRSDRGGGTMTVDGGTYTSRGTGSPAVYCTADITVNNAALTAENSEAVCIEVRNSADSTGGDNSSFYGTGAAALCHQRQPDTDRRHHHYRCKRRCRCLQLRRRQSHRIRHHHHHKAGYPAVFMWQAAARSLPPTSPLRQTMNPLRRSGATAAAVVPGPSMAVPTLSRGTGSPAVYCTADITVNNAALTAENSEAVCIEGLNSLSLTNCSLSGNIPENEQNDCDWTVILYQSMSGDSEIGESKFSMDGGSLTSLNGGLFYTTNTESSFYLKNVDITYSPSNNFFLKCTGNANKRGWGQSGNNGAGCTFTTDSRGNERQHPLGQHQQSGSEAHKRHHLDRFHPSGRDKRR